MELSVLDIATVPRTRYVGSQVIEMTSKQNLKIKLTGPAVDILDADVPHGKKWTANISVQIEETDA